MSAGSNIGMAKSDKHLTATCAQGWPRVDSHPSNRQKSQEGKMDEGNEQSFRKCVRHLFGGRRWPAPNRFAPEKPSFARWRRISISHLHPERSKRGARRAGRAHRKRAVFHTSLGEEAGRFRYARVDQSWRLARTMRWSWGLGSYDSAGR